MKLNIGCGQDYRAGWINIDNSTKVQTDFLVDIQTDKFPVDDESCDEVYASGVFEQVLENTKFVHVMNECWRVLETNGILTVIVPSSKFAIAFRDPFDCRHFIPETFDYFHFNHEHYKHYGKVYGFKPWEVLSNITQDNGIINVTLKKHV